MKIVVYSKPNCMPCAMTKQYLTSKGVQFDEFDITEDDALLEDFMNRGFASAPVVQIGDNWFNGFQPDKIDELI